MRIVGNPPSGGKKPTTPTIGTATDGGTGTTVSVAFTPSTYIGKSTITYTATSSPGSLTGTGSGSPITVSGLTTGTAYTFTVKGTTAYGVVSDNSAASNSVTPASPSSFESIATVTANGSQSTLSFTSIPGTYKSLQIRALSKDANGTNVQGDLMMQFNSNNTTANYRTHSLYGQPSGVTADSVAIDGWIHLYQAASRGSASTDIFGVSIIDIIDYASTTKNKTIRALSGSSINTTTSANGINISSGAWFQTSAITRIDFVNSTSSTFTSGTTIALYGVK